VTELSVLERVRAAVAEAGYDPRAIVAPPPGTDLTFGCRVGAMPDAVLWRARESAHAKSPICRACYLFAADESGHKAHILGCLAVRRFVEDCGRDRTEP
jgi:hypothetical protein